MTTVYSYLFFMSSILADVYFKNPGAIYILEQAVKKLFYLADFALFVLLSPVKQEEINA